MLRTLFVAAVLSTVFAGPLIAIAASGGPARQQAWQPNPLCASAGLACNRPGQDRSPLFARR